MPFDGLQSNYTFSLEDAVKQLGITPISEARLAEYKQQQCDNNPASPFYSVRHVLVVALIVTMLVGLLNLFLCLPSFMYAVASGQHETAAMYLLSTMASLVLIVAVDRTKVFSREGRRLKGPADWVEISVPLSLYQVAYRSDVPDLINDLVSRLSTKLPNSNVIIGELRQNSVVIDPYLIFSHNGDEVILGIWDQNSVVEHA